MAVKSIFVCAATGNLNLFSSVASCNVSCLSVVKLVCFEKVVLLVLASIFLSFYHNCEGIEFRKREQPSESGLNGYDHDH